MLDDLRATGDVRVTLLETDQTIDSHRSGKQVSIRVPDSLAGALPTHEARIADRRGKLIQEKSSSGLS